MICFVGYPEDLFCVLPRGSVCVLPRGSVLCVTQRICFVCYPEDLFCVLPSGSVLCYPEDLFVCYPEDLFVCYPEDLFCVLPRGSVCVLPRRSVLCTSVFSLIFFTHLPESQNIEKLSIYSNKFFYNFHLSKSSLTCPAALRANGLARRLAHY
jgi:hypothetical protein